MKTQNTFFIEKVTNNGVTNFQIVNRRNNKVMHNYASLANAAYRLFVSMACIPTYKDGSVIVLEPNSNKNVISQIINQYLLELSKKYNAIQKKMASSKFSYPLYMEMLSIGTEMELVQQKKETLQF